MTLNLPVSTDGTLLEMELTEAVHKPSVLSTTLLMAVKDCDVRGRIACDVGCGTGYLGLGLLLRGADHLFSVDISPEAVAATSDTASRNGLSDKITLLTGSLLAPLETAVELMISNPPSTARRIQPPGRALPRAIDGGELGNEAACSLVKEAAAKLTAEGVLYLPVTSLTALEATKALAREHFRDVTVVCTHDVPFQWFTLAIVDNIRQMHEEGHGYAVEHAGHPYWRIEILRCASPLSDR